MKRLFIGDIVLTMVEGAEPITNGALGIMNNQIIYVGAIPDEKEQSTYDEVIDCSNKVIMPGFINSHGHAAMSLLRGYADDLPLQEWLSEKIWPIEARFGPEQVKAGTLLSILEMIQSGTTCFVDMYSFMDLSAEAVLESKMRACLCSGVIGLDSDEVVERKFQESLRFALTWNQADQGRITTMLSPHAPYTCKPPLIKKFIEAAKEHQLPLHTHMSETAKEVQQNVDDYGVRPVEHLKNLGCFDVPCLVAHAVHLTENEIDILAEYDVKVSHNPGSNLKLGSGIAPISQMLSKGIRPSIGTDGAASNNNLDMLEEIQLTALIHKGITQDSRTIPARTALQMGTLYGAEAVFLEKEIGTLEVGKKADFITINLTDTHMQPLHHIESHLVYSACRNDVQDVYIDGYAVMKNRECLTLDKERVHYEAAHAFPSVC